jgi:hypothetical protein
MSRPIITIFFVILECLVINAQENSNYFITNTDNGQYLVYGRRFLIDHPDNACYELIEEITINEGKKYIVIQVLDDMENRRGVLIFDKKGNQINYEIVQNERKKYYNHYSCCVNVRELNGKLYFWEYTNLDSGEDYGCYYDSQTSEGNIVISRYYIFDPEASYVETKILQKNCKSLFLDDKLNCE